MSTLVYVHGTNGSGKSTLARAVLAAAGGPLALRHAPGVPKATYTTTHTPGRFLVGKYQTSCGGVDGILPYASVHDVLRTLSVASNHTVFAEGLVTPGVATCMRFAGYFDRHLFILLCTPVEQCIENVLKRRKEAGNLKPYDPTNLYKKDRSARSWAAALERAGLNIRYAQYDAALTLSLLELRIPPYDII